MSGRERLKQCIKEGQTFQPALGLDLDGTIDEASVFFKMLSNSWDGPVYVITYRNDEDEARKYAESFGVKADEVICVRSFAEKAQWIKKLNVVVFFDDTDEVIQHIPAGTCKVFKVRNEGNYDFSYGKWYYDNKTGINVGRTIK